MLIACVFTNIYLTYLNLILHYEGSTFVKLQARYFIIRTTIFRPSIVLNSHKILITPYFYASLLYNNLENNKLFLIQMTTIRLLNVLCNFIVGIVVDKIFFTCFFGNYCISNYIFMEHDMH